MSHLPLSNILGQDRPQAEAVSAAAGGALLTVHVQAADAPFRLRLQGGGSDAG